jgi:hypothetical protein
MQTYRESTAPDGTPQPPGTAQPATPAAAPSPAAAEKRTQLAGGHIHSVSFVTYPKLLFCWPILLMGLLLWPLAGMGVNPEALAWVYILTAFIVFLTLGVDVDRNQAIFWAVLIGLMYFLGRWLQDAKGFTVFGNIYRFFDNLDAKYDPGLGLAVSVVLAVPFLLMIGWAQLNDRWRITHNEFEHYVFGKMDDSLGRGAKTIRAMYPDVLEMLLGMAGTLIVYNASGTRELRRIPHVLLLPLVRKRLNKILETTSVTQELSADDEQEEEDNL